MDIEDILALKMMNEAGKGDAASAIATECAERHARIHCGGETCEICRFNVEKYVGVRQGRAYQIQADRSHNILRTAIICLGALLSLIMLVLLIQEVIDQQYNRERVIEQAVQKRLSEAPAKPLVQPATVQAPAATTTAKPKVDTEAVSVQQIKAVCKRVGDTVRDLNHDGQINCIDYSLRFKEIVPEADFIWNYNPPKMNHLFVSWGGWYIEPQSKGGDNWPVAQFWKGKGYDPAYNSVSIFEDWYTRKDPSKK